MVFLEFEVEADGQFEQVWAYFSDFQNIKEWDPTVSSCKVLKKNPNQVGSLYEIVSVVNGKQSTIIYETKNIEKSNEHGSIFLYGLNSRITADDQITCRRKGSKKTAIIYRADICLRHILCFLTPCIKGGLYQLADRVREGCIQKSTQKWGKAK